MSGGHFYKHERCTDMLIYVIKRQWIGPDYGKYRIMYVDKNYRRFAAEPETVQISHEDRKKWKYVRSIS